PVSQKAETTGWKPSYHVQEAPRAIKAQANHLAAYIPHRTLFWSSRSAGRTPPPRHHPPPPRPSHPQAPRIGKWEKQANPACSRIANPKPPNLPPPGPDPGAAGAAATGITGRCRGAPGSPLPPPPPRLLRHEISGIEVGVDSTATRLENLGSF
ncbi:hypothetical protein U9M48_025258, partial [Paspalum notatum var. saurae]